MTEVRGLGCYEIALKYLMLPWYRLPSNIGSWQRHLIIGLRFILMLILIFLGIVDSPVISLAPYREAYKGDFSILVIVVEQMDWMLIKIGVVTLFVICIAIRKEHMNFLNRLANFQEYCSINENARGILILKIWTAFDFFCVIGYHALIHILNMQKISYTDYLIENFHHMILMIYLSIKALLLLYISHIIILLRYLSTYLLKNMEKVNSSTWKKFVEFLNLIDTLNSSLGILMFLLFFIHQFSACFGMYFVFWIIFNTNNIDNKALNCLIALIWAFSNIIIVGKFAMICESLEHRVEDLWHQINSQIDTILIPSRRRKLSNIVRLLLLKLHKNTGVCGYGGYRTNNSCIYRILGSIVSYLAIFIQFKQLEDESICEKLLASFQGEL
uniref:Gustatory receptor n=1 Tax=Phlebotomus papatasi TaxID=29031 RepID=A0A3F2ZEK9_PHLPP